MRLDAYATNDLPIIDTGLILQQEIAFEQGKIRGHAKEGIT
jgi:hypothetical protein